MTDPQGMAEEIVKNVEDRLRDVPLELYVEVMEEIAATFEASAVAARDDADAQAEEGGAL